MTEQRDLYYLVKVPTSARRDVVDGEMVEALMYRFDGVEIFAQVEGEDATLLIDPEPFKAVDYIPSDEEIAGLPG